MRTRARILSVLGMLMGGVGLWGAIASGKTPVVVFSSLMLAFTLVVGVFAWKVTLR